MAMSSMETVVCDKADSALMSGSPQTMPLASGNLDKDSSVMMAAHENEMLNMAKLEMGCGANQNVRKSEQRFIQVRRMHRFSGDSV